MTRRTLLKGAIAGILLPAKGLAEYLSDRQKVALHGPPARAKEIAQELDEGFVSERDPGAFNCKSCGVEMLYQQNMSGDRDFGPEHYEHTCTKCGTKHDIRYKPVGIDGIRVTVIP